MYMYDGSQLEQGIYLLREEDSARHSESLDFKGRLHAGDKTSTSYKTLMSTCNVYITMYMWTYMYIVYVQCIYLDGQGIVADSEA